MYAYQEKAEQSDENGDDSEAEDFKELSRNDQHKRLQKKAKKKKAHYKDGIGWIGLKSLTGANVSGWKFQVSRIIEGAFNPKRFLSHFSDHIVHFLIVTA